MSKRRNGSRRASTPGRASSPVRQRHSEPTPLTLVPPGTSHGHAEGLVPATADQTRVDTRQVQGLVGLIATGVLDEHLTTLQAALADRHRERRRISSRHAAARLEAGDRVRLAHGIRPLYLQGATGTVTGWVGQRAVVQLDEPTGRGIDGVVRCPPLSLELLSREDMEGQV